MSTKQFNATTELETLRQYQAIRRKKQFWHSRLTQHRAELVQLRQAGASYRELALWLRREKRMRFSHTTIARFLEKLPELKKGDGNYAELSQC